MRAGGPVEVLFGTCGGTIDKVYFDAEDNYAVGAPQLGGLLERARVDFVYEILPLLQKDSLEMTAADREGIRAALLAHPCRRVVLTHGTDTLVETAQALAGLEGRTIVLMGAMQPARFRESDADFNLGVAVAAVRLLPAGVYVAMHGGVFDPWKARKNRESQRIEGLGAGGVGD